MILSKQKDKLMKMTKRINELEILVHVLMEKQNKNIN